MYDIIYDRIDTMIDINDYDDVLLLMTWMKALTIDDTILLLYYYTHMWRRPSYWWLFEWWLFGGNIDRL